MAELDIKPSPVPPAHSPWPMPRVAASPQPRPGNRLDLGPIWAVSIAFVIAFAAVVGLHQGSAGRLGLAELLAVLAALALVIGAVVFRLTQARSRAAAGLALLKRSLDAVPQGRLVASPDGRTLFCNPAFRVLCSPTLDTAFAAPGVEGLLAVADGSDARNEIGKLAEESARGRRASAHIPVRPLGAPREIETGGGRPPLQEWRRVSVMPVPAVLGQPSAVLWAVDDVTEDTHRAAVAASEREQLLDLLGNVPVGLYSVDQDGGFRVVNETFAAWLGYSPEELVASDLRLHDLLHDRPADGQPPHVAAMPAADADASPGGGPPLARLRGRRGDIVTLRIVETVSQPIASLPASSDSSQPAALAEGDGEGGRGALRFANATIGAEDDIDDPLALLPRPAAAAAPLRYRTRSASFRVFADDDWELALHRSEQRFHRIFADAPIGIVQLDGRFVISAVNEAFRSLRQLQKGRLVGMPFRSCVQPADWDALEARLRTLVSGEAKSARLEMKLAGPADVEVAVFATLTETKSGEVDGYLLHVLDLSQQRQLEAQAAQSQRLLAVGQLAAGIAHDFNNILGVIQAHCELLHMRTNPKEHAFEHVRSITEQTQRARSMVQELLAFSRRQTLQPRVVDFTALLTEFRDTLGRIAAGHIEAFVDHDKQAYPIKADAGKLQQVMMNLAINARDAMTKPTPVLGASITFRTRNVSLTEALHTRFGEIPPGDYLRFDAADTGCGIPPEIMDRIFEPFFSTKETGEGTGLGLATVYGIVKQTGGHIDVESTVGVGTTFKIYLPRYVPTPEELTVASVERPERPRVKDLTGSSAILFVEDEDGLRKVNADFLRSKGHKVLEARNGETALQVLTAGRERVDILVTDVVMPGMDGPTLVRNARAAGCEVPAIFISGYAEESFRQMVGSDPAIHFLSKPFSLKELAAKVKEVIAERG